MYLEPEPVSNEHCCNETPLYAIGTAARMLRVSVHTLRMYERKGLVIPFRCASTHRLYSDQDIERLKCIRSTINEEKISIEGIRHILSLIPCWVIINCPEEQRASCAAYTGHAEPCWNTKRKAEFCLGKTCRDCQVYRQFAECRTIKEKMRELLGSQQPSGKTPQ